jgi:hypothetical protein
MEAFLAAFHLAPFMADLPLSLPSPAALAGHIASLSRPPIPFPRCACPAARRACGVDVFTRSRALAALLAAHAAARRTAGGCDGEALLARGEGVLGGDAARHFCVAPEDLRCLEGFPVAEGGEVATVFARADLRVVALARHGAEGLAAAQREERRRRLLQREGAGAGEEPCELAPPPPARCASCERAAGEAAEEAAVEMRGEGERNEGGGGGEEEEEAMGAAAAAEAEAAAAEAEAAAAEGETAAAVETPRGEVAAEGSGRGHKRWRGGAEKPQKLRKRARAADAKA